MIFDFCRATVARIQTSTASLLGQLLKEVKPSTISTAKLNTLLCLHPPPIKQVVFLRSYSLLRGMGDLILG